MFSWPELLTELTFAILPFVILSMVLWAKHELHHLLVSADISLASAVILGQAIARFIFISMKSQRGGAKKVRLGIAMLIPSLVIVFALAPTLVLIALIVNSAENEEAREFFLRPQLYLAFWSLACYFCLGFISMKVKSKQ